MQSAKCIEQKMEEVVEARAKWVGIGRSLIDVKKRLRLAVERGAARKRKGAKIRAASEDQKAKIRATLARLRLDARRLRARKASARTGLDLLMSELAELKAGASAEAAAMARAARAALPPVDYRARAEKRRCEAKSEAHKSSLDRATTELGRGEVATVSVKSLGLDVGRSRLNFTPMGDRVRVGVNDIIIFTHGGAARIKRISGVSYDRSAKELLFLVGQGAKVRRRAIKGVSAYGVW